MIVTTTPSVEGRAVADYLGIVTGEVVAGANVVKDAFAGIRDLVGGRARAYEGVLRRAREEAIRAMIADAEARGADAVVGVDIDYEVLGRRSGMLMVSASGTAVRLG